MPRRQHDSDFPLVSATVVLTFWLAACGPTDPEETGEEAPADQTAAEEQPADDEDPSGEDAEDDPAEVSDDAEADDAEADEDEAAEIDPARFSTEPRASEGFPETVTPPTDGEDLLLEDVRLGVHEDHDRLVFDHTGSGFPGWQVEYVEEALEPGSGHVIEMEGEAVLAVNVTGMNPGNAAEHQGQLLLETSWDEHDTFVEGTATTIAHHGGASYYISLDEVRDFDVMPLEDGSRLVVDILR